MGDTHTFACVPDLADYNEVDQDRNPITKSNEGSGDSIEDPDCTIDDAQKAQFQAKYYDPFAPKPPRGSVEDIQHSEGIPATYENIIV